MARLITDDAEVKAILIHYGLLDRLLEQRNQGTFATPWMACIHFYDHPTHWISAMKYEGFDNPSDNGYAISALPKSQCTSEQFRRAVTASAQARFPHGIQVAKASALPPKN